MGRATEGAARIKMCGNWVFIITCVFASGVQINTADTIKLEASTKRLWKAFIASFNVCRL